MSTNKFPYNPQISPAQFAQDRADFVKQSYFNNNSNVNANGRYTLGGNNLTYYGVRLSNPNKDPMGITLIWNFDNLNRNQRNERRNRDRDDSYRNVRYL